MVEDQMFGSTFPVLVVHLGVIIILLSCDCYYMLKVIYMFNLLYFCHTFYTSGGCCNICLLRINCNNFLCWEDNFEICFSKICVAAHWNQVPFTVLCIQCWCHILLQINKHIPATHWVVLHWLPVVVQYFSLMHLQLLLCFILQRRTLHFLILHLMTVSLFYLFLLYKSDSCSGLSELCITFSFSFFKQNGFSGLLRTTINKLKQDRCITPKLTFIRGGQDDATVFENYLIEEQDVDGSGLTSVMGFVSFLEDISRGVLEYLK